MEWKKNEGLQQEASGNRLSFEKVSMWRVLTKGRGEAAKILGHTPDANALFVKLHSLNVRIKSANYRLYGCLYG